MGSNSARARNSIEKSLEKPAAALITLSNLNQSGDTVQVDYNVSGSDDRVVLNVALVERGLKNGRQMWKK